jgi:SAM-dependent methyltransferase
MTGSNDPPEPIARRAYAMFADRYAAMAPTKPHNALYERPATLALLGEVAGLRIVDAGCGPGINAELLAKRGATVHGIDVTPEMIELAEQRCRGLHADFQLADLAKPLDWLASDTFDKVLCALALDYIEELAPVFRELRRVTRPGGTFVFSMGHPMSDWLHPTIRGGSIYYDRAKFGMHWSGFGEPKPFVEGYRRPLAEILNALVDAGWTFDHVVEPRPAPEMKAIDERHYDQLSRQPVFICIRARC